MDFRNKYLKYSPKITFDIFEKVWNKLIDSGYLPIGEYSVKKAFGDFKTLHRYFRTTESHPMEFNCYSVIPRLDWSETTVQEILGYDPFVKDDDFVLPERWCIKIPKFKDAPKEIIDWRVDVKNRGTWVSAGYLDNSGWHSNNITDGYTEISFDQFKKFVLKQDAEENLKINYYKCIKSDFPELVLGKLYPSHDGKLVKIPHGEYTSCFYVNDGGRFELSNKSAFDAQNQPKQPIKQAVHCETQEQWNFVIEKVRYSLPKTDFYEYKSESCVILNSNNHYGSLKWAVKGNYQILSFSEWCAQNNYEFLSKLENFYVVCETEKESDLCLMWAVDNGLVCDTRRVFISRDFNVFEVYNGKATINMRLRNVSAKNNKDFEDIIQHNLTSAIPPISEQTENNLSETLDRVRYRTMQTNQSDLLENALKSFICDIQHYDHEFLAQMIGGKVSKVNKVQISTDNEIKINIIQKQSIKI